MKRIKRHTVKTEKPEASSSYREHEEHDLAYYIHDRVELMHQVFSVLKYKEIKAVAPYCVRNLDIRDLQELCTEELLGISSKRLLAILDGAEAPSDTESSSPSPPPDLETISLDSISSDEHLLEGSKKKKKHKHRQKKGKAKKSQSQSSVKSPGPSGPDTELSRASRAGLTVLELLELQARARAIRAQLQNEQRNDVRPSESEIIQDSVSDSEVEIKEEPPAVVEIISSSEDEKPDVSTLAHEMAVKETPAETTKTSVTKRINDLIITVPATKAKKIKLNRNKPITLVQTTDKLDRTNVTVEQKPSDTEKTPIKPTEDKSETNKQTSEENKASEVKKQASETKTEETEVKKKKKRKKRKEHDSDHDEITLQLSDSEKMDLLEDLNENRTISSPSSSSSDESTEENTKKSNIDQTIKNLRKDDNVLTSDQNIKKSKIKILDTVILKQPDELIIGPNDNNNDNVIHIAEESCDTNDVGTETVEKTDSGCSNKHDEAENVSVTEVNVQIEKENEQVEPNKQTDHVPILHIEDSSQESSVVVQSIDESTEVTSVEGSVTTQNDNKIENTDDDQSIQTVAETIEESQDTQNSPQNDEENNETEQKSEGELSDRDSSEVETVDLKPEIIAISDEETKNKKKKKSKKAKKSKNKKEREKKADKVVKEADIIYLSDEIYELSDDSSCYEVEGTCISKEPTAEEIEALTIKIDEINSRDEVELNLTETSTKDQETDSSDQTLATNAQESDQNTQKLPQNVEISESEDNTRDGTEIEQISWKDRYLGSKKVKKVLTTSNLLNALRKKNIELKQKIEESKKIPEDKEKDEAQMEKEDTEIQGTIEEYNTLKSIKDNKDNQTENGDQLVRESESPIITTEMKRDAKQILKMYKKLLKYSKSSKKEVKKKKEQRRKLRKKQKIA